MFSFSLLHDQFTRADKVLSALFEGVYSRSHIQKGFDLKQITVLNKKDGLTYSNPKYYLRRGDVVTMNIVKIPSTLPPDFRPLEIVYENNGFLIISKDAGINTHPTAGWNGREGTLVNQLIGQIHDFDREKGEDRPGIVHRLDKDTSGLIIVAKNDVTMRQIQKLIHDHEVKKTYLALIIGIPKNTIGTIKSLIGRDPNERTKMTIKNPVEAREAITHYRVVETFHMSSGIFSGKDLALVEVTLETGRTHQIRVHLASIGHPIIGDKTYGDESSNIFAEKKFGLSRQFLHAWKLGFEFKGVQYDFEAPLKKDLRKVLDILGSKVE